MPKTQAISHFFWNPWKALNPKKMDKKTLESAFSVKIKRIGNILKIIHYIFLNFKKKIAIFRVF